MAILLRIHQAPRRNRRARQSVQLVSQPIPAGASVLAKSPKAEPERPHILIDQREQVALCFTDSFTTERVLLPVGDYSLAGATDSVVIERKRNGELQSCCGTDRARFIEQIERMRQYP